MKIKNILLTGVAALALASCNDYLDVDAPSAYSEDFVFSQKTEIERALNGVYAQALVGDLYGNAYQLTFNYNSDVDIQISSDGSHSHSSYARYFFIPNLESTANNHLVGRLDIKLNSLSFPHLNVVLFRVGGYSAGVPGAQ